MKKTKGEKGITLIALIITVVLLLILALVAISLVKKDALLSKADREIDKYTNKQSEYNSSMGEIKNYLDNELLFDDDPDDELDYETGNGETNNDETQIDSDLDLLERYILGEDKTGRYILEIINIYTQKEDRLFIDEETTIADASTSITYFDIVNEEPAIPYSDNFIYFEYNNKVYRTEYSTLNQYTKELRLVYVPVGREGQIVGYDSNEDGIDEEWVIITDREGLVEIVSKNAMGKLYLGTKDESVNVTTDLDGNGEVGNDVDISIASYNNAITTINNYCKSLVTATDNEGVRSLGGTNNSYTAYHSTKYDEYGKNITVGVSSGDFQFEADMAKIYYHRTFGDGCFWIASRGAREGNNDFTPPVYTVSFSVRICWDYDLQADNLFILYPDDYITTAFPAAHVRPVIINPSGI